MAEIKSSLLADLIIDGKKSKDSGLYISEMTFSEGVSQVSKAVLTICSNSVCLKLRGKKDSNGNQSEEGLLDYLDKKATICFLDKEKISRTFTGKITSVTHLGVSNTVSGNLYKYELIIEPNIADMRFAHHTRQIKKSIKNTLEDILSTYYGDATIDFVISKPDTNAYLFYQQNETDYDFFMRLLAQFGLSFFVSSQKNQNSDEYYEQVTISDGKSFELPEESRQPNSHTDRNLNILVNKSSKTLSENIRIATWQMSNSISIDDICRTDSPKPQGDEKRLWFLNSMATPHSETQSDSDTRDKIASNYLDSIHVSSANWFGTARLNDFQATDVLNIFDFYAPCNLDTEDKEKAALLSDDTIRARIISLNLVLTNILPFEVASEGSSASAEVKFRCAEISKEAPSVFTPLTDQNALSAEEPATKANLVAASIPVANEETSGVTLKKATVCYKSGEATTGQPAKNAASTINIDSQTGESYFYAKIDNSNVVSEVLFTMPLAGLGQGLYKYPRIGERIFVLDNKDSRYVLHSYIPDSTKMPFFNNAAIPSDAAVATVLRHSSDNFINGSSEADLTCYLGEEKSGLNKPTLKQIARKVSGSFAPKDYDSKDIKYSEIGMYSGSTTKDKDGNSTWSPEVLRIQTPGNQYNHTGLANISTANSFVFSTPNANQEDSKLGSFCVVDVGSVIIDAQKSITLKVGGNIISITESGVSIISQATCTESTPYDSVLSLSPMGAKLSGLGVSVESAISTNISDGLGASMSLAKGGVSISGHTVDLSTVDHLRRKWDIACYTVDLAQYAGYFASDQIFMRKKINTGYNDMVADGYFNPQKLAYRMQGASRDNEIIKDIIDYTNVVWGLAQAIVNFGLGRKSTWPPLRGSLAVYTAGVFIDLGIAVVDAVLATLALAGCFSKLTPEQVQRKNTIYNFIKVTEKTVFVYIKFAALASYTVGDISWFMVDPNEIKTYSKKLTADFQEVASTAHTVPFVAGAATYNPALDALPEGPVKTAAKTIDRSVVIGANTALSTVLGAAMAAAAEAPAFKLTSSNATIGLKSNALTGFGADVTTGKAEFNIQSATTTDLNIKSGVSAGIKFTTPNAKIDASTDLDINAKAPLNISSTTETKVTGGTSTIDITTNSINMTGTMLDTQVATLKMKADAALQVEASAKLTLKGALFDIKNEALNIQSTITKMN